MNKLLALRVLIIINNISFLRTSLMFLIQTLPRPLGTMHWDLSKCMLNSKSQVRTLIEAAHSSANNQVRIQVYKFRERGETNGFVDCTISSGLHSGVGDVFPSHAEWLAVSLLWILLRIVAGRRAFPSLGLLQGRFYLTTWR